jgi:glutamine amidotransferase
MNGSLSHSLIVGQDLLKGKYAFNFMIQKYIFGFYGHVVNYNKKTKGLNFIEGEVRKLNCGKLKIPHIGWNNIIFKKNSLLQNDIFTNLDFYFLHSYVFNPKIFFNLNF